MRERLQELQRQLDAAQTDYEVILVLTRVLTALVNDSLFSRDLESAQLLREIAIESVNHKPKGASDGRYRL